MQEVRKYDVDIDYCTNCKGVWLDRGEIDKIANMQTRYDEEHYRNYHRDRDYDDYYDDYYHYGGHRRRRRGFFGDLFDFWLEEIQKKPVRYYYYTTIKIPADQKDKDVG
jgi:uncharacterized protein